MKKVAVVLSTVFLALLILSVSFFRCSVTRSLYAYSATPLPSSSQETVEKEEMVVNYVLPYQGRILPDSPLWFAKAGRDRLWLWVTTNETKKAELSLLFADKRLLAAKELFLRNKPALALSTLTKAEKYLEKAGEYEAAYRKSGADTKSFLLTLINASLKHRQVIEEMVDLAPEDTKPEVIKMENYPNGVYQKVSDALQSQGATVPKNPFNTN